MPVVQDPEKCWSCGKPGSKKTYLPNALWCVVCDVTWSLHEIDKHGGDTATLYRGEILKLVDHTDPRSSSSPALCLRVEVTGS